MEMEDRKVVIQQRNAESSFQTKLYAQNILFKIFAGLSVEL